jgi:hypothetical protein
MDGYWGPFFIIATTRKENRTDVANAMLPAVLPGSGSQRVAIAAVAANQQVTETQRREARVATETLNVVSEAVANGGTPDLSRAPTLSRVVNRAARVQEELDTVVQDIRVDAQLSQQALATEAVKVISAAIQTDGDRLTLEEVQAASPVFATVLLSLPLQAQVTVVQLPSPPLGGQLG